MKSHTCMTAHKQFKFFWICDTCSAHLNDNELLCTEHQGEEYCPDCKGTSFTEMSAHTVYIEVYAKNELDALATAQEMEDDWQVLNHVIRIKKETDDE